MIPNIKWYMGQALMPEHFEMQQNALSEQIYTLKNSSGVPCRGLNNFIVDKSFLNIGILRVTKFCYFEIDGNIIDIERNATAKDLDLNTYSQNKADIYINIYEEELEKEYNKIAVKCHWYSIVPGFSKDLRAKYYHKMIELDKELDKTWKISPSFVPELNNISIFINEETICSLHEIHKKIIMSYERMLKNSDFIAKAVEFRECCAHAYDLKLLLGNIGRGIDIHPYQIYLKLSELYNRITLFFDILPESILLYSHDKAIENIIDLKNKIDELISNENKSANYIKFENNQNIFCTPELPDSAIYAKNIFFVVQKRSKEQVINIENLRLVSPARHSMAEKLALPGIKKTEMKKIPFKHYFSDNCVFYKIDFGKEWDFVIKDRIIEFKNKPEYKNTKFYIYYF